MKYQRYILALTFCFHAIANGGHNTGTLNDEFGQQGRGAVSGNNTSNTRGATAGATGAAGGATGAAASGNTNYEKRSNPTEVKEVGKTSIAELKKADTSFTSAVDKLQQSFTSGLAALKPPADDPALLKQLGEDLAKRKQASETEPTVGGAIVDDLVKGTKDRSDLAVETVKQVAAQLQPPPAAPAAPAAPATTVAERIRAYASANGVKSTINGGIGGGGNALVRADQAGASKIAAIPTAPGASTARGVIGAAVEASSGRGMTSLASQAISGGNGFAPNNTSPDVGGGGGGRGSRGGGGFAAPSGSGSSGSLGGDSFFSNVGRGVASSSAAAKEEASRGIRTVTTGSSESSSENPAQEIVSLDTDEKKPKKAKVIPRGVASIRNSSKVPAPSKAFLSQVKEKLEMSYSPTKVGNQ